MSDRHATNRHPGFRHRPESFGIVASFCTKCFATVARTRAEEDLATFEREHVCNSHDLEWLERARKSTTKFR